MESRLETQDERMARELRAMAEEAIKRLEDAMSLAELPPFPGIGPVTLLPQGIHVQLGGCNVRTILALADFVLRHVRCTGRIVSGEIVPAGLAGLPCVQLPSEASHE